MVNLPPDRYILIRAQDLRSGDFTQLAAEVNAGLTRARVQKNLQRGWTRHKALALNGLRKLILGCTAVSRTQPQIPFVLLWASAESP